MPATSGVPRGVIDTTRIGGKIPATMHSKNLRAWMTLQHAIEDQVVQGQRVVSNGLPTTLLK